MSTLVLKCGKGFVKVTGLQVVFPQISLQQKDPGFANRGDESSGLGVLVELEGPGGSGHRGLWSGAGGLQGGGRESV